MLSCNQCNSQWILTCVATDAWAVAAEFPSVEEHRIDGTSDSALATLIVRSAIIVSIGTKRSLRRYVWHT